MLCVRVIFIGPSGNSKQTIFIDD